MTLYQSYRTYCISNGNHPLANRTFSDRLRKNGFKLEKKNYGIIVYVEQEKA